MQQGDRSLAKDNALKRDAILGLAQFAGLMVNHRFEAYRTFIWELGANLWLLLPFLKVQVASTDLRGKWPASFGYSAKR